MFYRFLLELSAFFRELSGWCNFFQARPSDMCERAQPMAPAVKSVPKSFLWHAAVETYSYGDPIWAIQGLFIVKHHEGVVDIPIRNDDPGVLSRIPPHPAQFSIVFVSRSSRRG